MAMNLLEIVIPKFLYFVVFLILIADLPACNTTTISTSSKNSTNSTVSTNTTTFSQVPSNKTHHRCQVWKNKCEQHKLYCQDKNQEENPRQKTFNSCCEPLQNSSLGIRANDSGIYTIRTSSFSTTQAWCDMEKDNGGWMVIMRRSSTSVNFNRLMHEYEDGFGSLDGDFWYSLKTVSQLTSRMEYELRVDLYDKASDTHSSAHATYGSFKISPEDYKLHLGQFNASGNLHDSLMQFNGRPFLAKRTHDDKSNDSLLTLCTKYYTFGGWWFADNCVGKDAHPGSILTRQYLDLSWYSHSASTNGYWRKFGKYELKMRQKECTPLHTSTNSYKK